VLCQWDIGNLFLQRVTTDLPARVDGKKLKFHRKLREMSKDAVQKVNVLEKTRFMDPGIQEKRDTISYHLREGFTTVRALHIGFIIKEGYTKIFSSEFKLQKYGQLRVEYEHKLFRIVVRLATLDTQICHAKYSPQLGEPEIDTEFSCIVITFDNLRGIGLGDDHGKPCMSARYAYESAIDPEL
jgi:hypothetical protein